MNEKKGYVEIWNGVRRVHILLEDDGANVYVDDDLHDGCTFEEFVEECGGHIFASLSDYKKGNKIDLKQWVKEIGWVEPPED